MPAAHDIYAEQLSELRRGHALYYPEPAPDDGPMHIGDVGFLKQGAFYRLFNISRAPEDEIQRFGVPDGYERLDLGLIRSYDTALEPGPLHSRTVYTLDANIGAPSTVLPLDASFRFNCTSKRGAILMQETQMKREEAVQIRLLEDYLRRHCQSWYNFARRNHFSLGFGQIMLVTECSKTGAWSSAVYSNSTKEFSVSFSAGNAFVPYGAGLSASAGIERAGSVERRRSVQRPNPDDPPPPKDHTVFFKAFHLGIRESYVQSLVALFVRSREIKSSGRLMPLSGSIEAITWREAQSGSSSDNSIPENSHSLETIAHPDLPDFHPASPLLALQMENTNDNCVVVHDNEWCSPTEETSEMMTEYVQFHFDVSEAAVEVLHNDPQSSSTLLTTLSHNSSGKVEELPIPSLRLPSQQSAIQIIPTLLQTLPTLLTLPVLPSSPNTSLADPADRLSWTGEDPRESLLFNSWGVVYRFQTSVSTLGQRVTTLWRTIRTNKEDRAAKLEWAANGGLGRIVLGKTTCLMTHFVLPDPNMIKGLRYFTGPDGLQYRWQPSSENGDILLRDTHGVTIARFHPTRPTHNRLGIVHAELHFIKSAGEGRVMHPLMMDTVVVSIMLYRFCMQWNL